MTPKEFKEEYGVHPSEIFGRNSTTPSKNQAKKKPKQRKRAMNPKATQNPLKSIYEGLSEDEHQAIFIEWLDHMELYFEASINGLYIPNPHPKSSKAYLYQRNVNNAILKKHKKLGFRKGIADVKVYLPNIELNIELKKVGGKPTAEQLENVERFKSFKYATYEIIVGYKDAIAYVERFMQSSKNT